MFVVRFLLLLFLAFYGWSMGRIPSDELNGFGKLMAYSSFIFIPALYLLPTYEAWKKNHRNIAAISVINVFLGWSLIGWVGALVWAFKSPPFNQKTVVQPPISTLAPTPAQSRKTKICPYCAEEILAAAVKCKHCGSDVGASAEGSV
ncbi:superinfection immunity protein [Pseudomonas sp. BF-R-12]|uniref:superinfection immunity protein n=1 Tax=Pseudomonas sp. BF-R-12 TaxID=2832363 RepID=UPI001CBF5E4B|nr:superinfection immunity protein [Pseudomonas sp. BF-R-12]